MYVATAVQEPAILHTLGLSSSLRGLTAGPSFPMSIPFNRPAVLGKELANIADALSSGHLSGDGAYTRRCNEWLAQRLQASRALLTHSGTAALEMAAILANVGPGDEVIMPSFTFVSTANAFVLRGATPVFVDIRPDTLNLDEQQLDAAVTERTRVIVPVHYAGVACEMDAIISTARRHDLLIVEDAAQALGSTYDGRPLGTIGDLGAISFHETKNIISGEGGALLLRDSNLVERAEIIREKGTNRSAFFRGQVDKYTWVDVGSSYLPSEIIAAFLLAQLEEADNLTERRRQVWLRYHEAFEPLEASGIARRPIVPARCGHNAHLYYLILPSLDARTALIETLKARGIAALFHYVPLDNAPAGRRFGRAVGELAVTHDMADRLVRLPVWPFMTDEEVDRVIESVNGAVVTVP
jgi:dTDP-4-amino-4,6-dideoxygalactose transaminase